MNWNTEPAAASGSRCRCLLSPSRWCLSRTFSLRSCSCSACLSNCHSSIDTAWSGRPPLAFLARRSAVLVDSSSPFPCTCCQVKTVTQVDLWWARSLRTWCCRLRWSCSFASATSNCSSSCASVSFSGSSSSAFPCTSLVNALQMSIPPFKVRRLSCPISWCATPGGTPIIISSFAQPLPSMPLLAQLSAFPSISEHASSSAVTISSSLPSALCAAAIASTVSHCSAPLSERVQKVSAIISSASFNPISLTLRITLFCIFRRAVTTLLPFRPAPVHCHST